MGMMPIILLLFAASVAIGLGGLAFSGPSAAKVQKRRLTALRDRHAAHTGAVVEAQMRRIQASRSTRMDGIATRLLPRPAVLKQRLERTGKTWSPGQYLTASIGLLVVLTAVLRLRGLPFLPSFTVGLFGALFLPHWWVGRLITKRVKQFNARFADAIDLLVRGLRSGLPISETLQVVGQEVPGPVGVEFRNVSDKIKIGRTMDAALIDTAERLNIPEFNFFCISLAIQRETGGNLAETLSNLAEVLRKRLQMKLKIRAMSSESKASAMIIGALPFIVFGLITFINPDYMAAFYSNPKLTMIGIGGMVWMGIGVFIMSKMISFEI